jgi:hypothetical protein
MRFYVQETDAGASVRVPRPDPADVYGMIVDTYVNGRYINTTRYPSEHWPADTARLLADGYRLERYGPFLAAAVNINLLSFSLAGTASATLETPGRDKGDGEVAWPLVEQADQLITQAGYFREIDWWRDGNGQLVTAVSPSTRTRIRPDLWAGTSHLLQPVLDALAATLPGNPPNGQTVNGQMIPGVRRVPGDQLRLTADPIDELLPGYLHDLRHAGYPQRIVDATAALCAALDFAHRGELDGAELAAHSAITYLPAVWPH